MAIEKQVVIDKIEVLERGEIQVRQATRIIDEGIEIAKTYHRWAYAPGDDVSEQTDLVKAISNLVWTPKVVADYQAYLQSVRPQIEETK